MSALARARIIYALTLLPISYSWQQLTVLPDVVFCRAAVSPPHSPIAVMTSRQPQLTPNAKCAVCNDDASGFHYGVFSCEGCKVSLVPDLLLFYSSARKVRVLISMAPVICELLSKTHRHRHL